MVELCGNVARMVANEEPALVRRLRVVDLADDVVVEMLHGNMVRKTTAGDHTEFDTAGSHRLHHTTAVEAGCRTQNNREAEPRAGAVLALNNDSWVVFEQRNKMRGVM